MRLRACLGIALFAVAGCSSIEPEIRAADGPSSAADQCGVVRVKGTRLGRTRDDVTPGAAGLSCVEDTSQLEAAKQCARATTQAAREAAVAEVLQAQNLHLIQRPATDPESGVMDIDETRLVPIGTVGGCGAPRTSAGGILLAADANGQVVQLNLSPITEARIYPTCECSNPCGGAEQPEMPIYLILEEGERVARTETVRFPALVVGTRGVEPCVPQP